MKPIQINTPWDSMDQSLSSNLNQELELKPYVHITTNLEHKLINKMKFQLNNNMEIRLKKDLKAVNHN